jgi:hypothetical protein
VKDDRGWEQHIECAMHIVLTSDKDYEFHESRMKRYAALSRGRSCESEGVGHLDIAKLVGSSNHPVRRRKGDDWPLRKRSRKCRRGGNAREGRAKVHGGWQPSNHTAAGGDMISRLFQTSIGSIWGHLNSINDEYLHGEMMQSYPVHDNVI